MPTTLKFYVREDGQDFGINCMTEPECAAIGECVDDICQSDWGKNYWFEADTCLLDEDDGDEDDDYVEPTYGLLRCFTHNPAPRNYSIYENRIPYDIPQDILNKVAGKTFVVRPRQLGLNPWGKKVEILFESVAAPAPTPVPVPAPTPVASVVEKTTTTSSVSVPQAQKNMIAGVLASDLIARALATKSH